MTKQHEILAVETAKEGIAQRILKESTGLFHSKHNLLTGHVKTLTMLEDTPQNKKLEEASYEQVDITTTVPERIAYTVGPVSDWLNVVLQKESTNQKAVADIVIDGETIATGLPATFLLGMETKLKVIRGMYDVIPTLAPGIIWDKDDTERNGVFRTHNAKVTTKTQKVPHHKVLYQHSEQHPAQIEKWMEEVVTGNYTQITQCGMVSAARKMELLGRIDKLMQAVKQARSRANNVDVEQRSIGQELFDYINA